MYRPLPDCLRVGESEIEGVGIIATEEITAGCNLGATHYPRAGHLHGFIRTPLGGFINHSESPNCTKMEVDGVLFLVTLYRIVAGQELTVRYTLYDVTSTMGKNCVDGREAPPLRGDA